MLPLELDTKVYVVIGSVLLLCVFSFFAGYSFKETDPYVICAPHIARISELTTQVSEIEKGVAESRAKHIKDAAERESDLCANKIKDMREKYMRLRCKICEAQP